MGAVGDEVVGPDMVRSLRPQTYARAIVEPQTSRFRLFARGLQPLASPDPLNTLLIHSPASSTKQRRNTAISVAAILAGKLDNVGSQCYLVIGVAGILRCVDRCCPQARHARLSEMQSSVITWPTHARRWEGLGSFPLRPPLGSVCPASDPTLRGEAGCSRYLVP